MSIKACDDLGADLLIRLDDFSILFRIELTGELRGIDKITEHHRELAIIESLATLTMPEVGRLHVRIGIATGVVVVAGGEKGAVGETPNLAARLQAVAPPGGVLISHDTYRYVRGIFYVTPQPPLAVKGKREPVRTYQVRRAKPRPFRSVARGVAGVETRTVGRDAESQ